MTALLWICTIIWLLQWAVMYQLLKVDEEKRTTMSFASLLVQTTVIIYTLVGLVALFLVFAP